MAASFATYASQFLNRQQHGSGSVSSSHPMFFSFVSEEESRTGHDLTVDLDDLDDPHMRSSETSKVGRGVRDDSEEDDDPYLRLDEDEHIGRSAMDPIRHNTQSAPLIPRDGESLTTEDSPRGWLAHLASPLMRHSRSRSSSPADSHSSQHSIPPPKLYGCEDQHVAPLPPVTNREPVSLSLTESLLPRDGLVRPLDFFSLPNPRQISRGRLKHHDPVWTVAWCTGVSFCVFFSILLLFVTSKPTELPPITLPYTTLLHTVPMLTILTFSSAFVAYTHVFLLRIFVKPMMIATSIFIPVTLFISAIWAFVGSFMWDRDLEPTWGETMGLRLFSLVPFALSLLTARKLLNLSRHIHATSSTLNLTTELLIANPFVLALSPVILLLTLILSIPFLTLIFRLLLIGKPVKESTTWEWHIYGWANWSITGAIIVWLWSWGVARGILRMTCATVIGSWYFATPDLPPPSPSSTYTIRAALTRSTGTSLGTVALSALILTSVRLLTLLTLSLRRLPSYIPTPVIFLSTIVRIVVGYLDSITAAMSKYALVYSGLTGDPFMNSARRAKALTSSVEVTAVRSGGHAFSVEPPLSLLTVAPLTLTFPFSLTTYLFVAHTLDAPKQALSASVLAGGITALVGLFCIGLIRDVADTLYICYCIDKNVGERRKHEVFDIFEYDSGSQNCTQQHPRPGHSQPVLTPNTSSEISRNYQQYSPQQSQQRTRCPVPVPKPEYMPSESTKRFLPRQPLEPQSPSLPCLEDHDEEIEPGLFHDSRRQYQSASLVESVKATRPHKSQQERLLTSTELNMKSWAREKPKPYDVSPDVEDTELPRAELSSPENGEGSNVCEQHQEGKGSMASQLFPGSGLF